MSKILKAWNYLMARLKEPSTYASVAALATMAGVNIDATPVVHDSLTAASVVFGMIGLFASESK
jgi:hypothetical protein